MKSGSRRYLPAGRARRQPWDQAAFSGRMGVVMQSDIRFGANEQAQAGLQIRVGELDCFGAFRRGGHGGNNQVDFVGLERRNEAIEWNVLDFDFTAQGFAEGVGQIHANARRMALRVGHLERRIGQFHANDELVVGWARAAVEETEQRGEDGKQLFHQSPESGEPRENCRIK